MTDSTRNRLLSILNFVRSHNLIADIVGCEVHFRCCDGKSYRTASMATARTALHY